MCIIIHTYYTYTHTSTPTHAQFSLLLLQEKPSVNEVTQGKPLLEHFML